MGFLLLDTCVSDGAKAWWVTEADEVSWQVAGRAQGVAGIIARERCRLANELEGIAVVAGPGRFSSVRVGILYAHLLSRWYKKPLYELTLADVETREARNVAVQRISAGSVPSAEYIAPIYDREPNITTPRI